MVNPNHTLSRAERRAQRDAEHRAKREADRQRVLDRLTDDDFSRRITEEQQVHIDRGGAVALAVLVVIQIAIVRSLASYPVIASQLHLQLRPGLWPYAAAVACFLPLMFRRRYPGPVLLATALFTGLYLAMPWPPAIVIVAPMIALFTVAERYGGRRAVPIGIVLGAIVLGVSALTVSVSYTVAQVVAILALLGLSAALGHTAQTRQELFVEVKRMREEAAARRIEEERLRIARDVHDIMAHSLTLMTLQADAGATGADDPEKVRAAFDVIGDTGRATLRDLRSMLSVLAGDEGGDSPREPVADLGQLGELVGSVRETGLDVQLRTKGDLNAVPSAVAVSAYRLVQESLTNVVRHARAAHVAVEVTAEPERLRVSVIDDGVGGEPDPSGAGRGLQGMRERVGVLGGTIGAGPAAGGGFAVRAEIPLTRSKTCRSE